MGNPASSAAGAAKRLTYFHESSLVSLGGPVGVDDGWLPGAGAMQRRQFRRPSMDFLDAGVCVCGRAPPPTERERHTHRRRCSVRVCDEREIDLEAPRETTKGERRGR